MGLARVYTGGERHGVGRRDCGSLLSSSRPFSEAFVGYWAIGVG